MIQDGHYSTGSNATPGWGTDPPDLSSLARLRRPAGCLIKILLVAAVIAGVVWWMFREHWSSHHDIKLADGQVLHVRESGSTWRYVGFGHAGGFGGGDYRHKLEFTWKGRECEWNGNSIPIVLQFDGAYPVLATFDRETDSAKITFRWFRLDGGTWQEWPLSSFPPHLTMQNLWMGTPEEAAAIARADPAEREFRWSLMAKLRHCIFYRVQYWELQGQDVQQGFLEIFARRHFLPPYDNPEFQIRPRRSDGIMVP